MTNIFISIFSIFMLHLIFFANLLTTLKATNSANSSGLNANNTTTTTEGTIWAVLVAGSHHWWNYRHQADVCHAWQTLTNHGVDPEHIITMMYDDVAWDEKNPFKGKLFNSPRGKDVYGGVRIDYKGEDVNPENFMGILLGDEQRTGGKRVLKSTKADKVFVFFTDHGGVGLLCFLNDTLTLKDFSDTLIGMHSRGMYKELTFYLETCESGSMFDWPQFGSLNMYAMTASNTSVDSWGCYCSNKKVPGVCLGDLFSVKWMGNSDKGHLLRETLNKQYDIVWRETNESPVTQYGNLSIATEFVAEFMGSKEPSKLLIDLQEEVTDVIPSRDAPLHYFTGQALDNLKKQRSFLDDKIAQLVKSVLTNPSDQSRALKTHPGRITKMECHHNVVQAFNQNCFNFANNPYALKYGYVLANFCEFGNDADKIVKAMTQFCNAAGLSTIQGIE